MTVDCAKLNTGCEDYTKLDVTVDYTKLNAGCDCRSMQS